MAKAIKKGVTFNTEKKRVADKVAKQKKTKPTL
jgi:hypothetical protein